MAPMGHSSRQSPHAMHASSLVDDLDALLGACVDTDAATDALIGQNHRMRHEKPLSLRALKIFVFGELVPLQPNSLWETYHRHP